MAHWTERLFRDQADSYAEFFEGRVDQAGSQAEDALALVAATVGARPERVLDVACGTGRHVVAFARNGCTVEGLDFSTEFVERARERAREAGVADRTTLHVHDMRRLGAFEGSFDLVTLFWNSLGYYGKETDRELLAAVEGLLAEDGALLVEVANKEYLVRNFEDASVREREDTLHVERRSFDVETARFHHELDLFDVTDDGYAFRETMEWEYRGYAPAELVELAEAAGFDSASLFADLEGEALSIESPSAVLLAH